VRVYDDMVVFECHEFGKGGKIGADWIMPLGKYDPHPFARTELLKVIGKPQFRADAKLDVEYVQAGVAEVSAAKPLDQNNPVNPVNLVKKENLSSAARAVLDAGRELWRYYHAQPDANPNASYYDIRLHFQGVKRTASGKEQMNATSSDATYNALLANLRAAHKTLAAQIAPKVYEYGFLKA
jgi:hypothetical protein